MRGQGFHFLVLDGGTERRNFEPVAGGNRQERTGFTPGASGCSESLAAGASACPVAGSESERPGVP